MALQCSGSDAFSGIGGNPLAAWVAKEVICYGGAANLAETDELIGAERYVLDKVRDAATVREISRHHPSVQRTSGVARAPVLMATLLAAISIAVCTTFVEIAGRSRQAPPGCAVGLCY
ncbi:MAG: UxaA family hydrolase [Anaerolineae bacterium]